MNEQEVVDTRENFSKLQEQLRGITQQEKDYFVHFFWIAYEKKNTKDAPDLSKKNVVTRKTVKKMSDACQVFLNDFVSPETKYIIHGNEFCIEI